MQRGKNWKCLWLLGPILGLVAGCAESRPALTIESVTPSDVSADRETPILIRGSFYAPLGADLSTGELFLRDELAVELGELWLNDVELLSEHELRAVIPALVPAGTYTLAVEDTLERRAELEDAVEVWAADISRPTVVITSHNAGDVVRPGASFTVFFTVADELPGLVRLIEWTLSGALTGGGRRELAVPSRLHAGAIRVDIPHDPADVVIRIVIEAEDDAPWPNRGSAYLALRLTLCESDAECDDGLFCNGAELCFEGVCTEGRRPFCDDLVECTVDVCDEVWRACTHEANDAFCDDLRYCNGAEGCDEVEGCLAGVDPCDDGEPCTVDFCSEGEPPGESGECLHVPDDSLCDDGRFCNGRETCALGYGCLDGVDPCTDPFECTASFCDEEGSFCEIVLNHDLCEDGDECTVDRCSKDLGCLSVPGTEGPPRDRTCEDGEDNDCDGLRDLDDPDCHE